MQLRLLLRVDDAAAEPPAIRRNACHQSARLRSNRLAKVLRVSLEYEVAKGRLGEAHGKHPGCVGVQLQSNMIGKLSERVEAAARKEHAVDGAPGFHEGSPSVRVLTRVV